MATQFVTIQVQSETKTRLYHMKGPNRTYDSCISELLEKQSRSASTTIETGSIIYPKQEEKIN